MDIAQIIQIFFMMDSYQYLSCEDTHSGPIFETDFLVLWQYCIFVFYIIPGLTWF